MRLSAWPSSRRGCLFSKQCESGGDCIYGINALWPQAVALHEPARVIVGQPHFALGVLPRERFYRQVYSCCLAIYHQRRAATRVAKNDEFGRPQPHADLPGTVCVIYAGEHNKTAPCRSRDNPVDRFRHGNLTRIVTRPAASIAIFLSRTGSFKIAQPRFPLAFYQLITRHQLVRLLSPPPLSRALPPRVGCRMSLVS